MNESETLISLSEAFHLINISIATAKIEHLYTPYREIRPAMHSILVGRIGSLKSSILYEICAKFHTIPTFNLSSANILGSVDKTTGIPIKPTIWEQRNSIVPIDELFIDSHSPNQRHALSVLLTVLEKPEFQKKIAYRVNDFSEKDGDLFCRMKDGTIHVKTRFVLIANTMQPLFRKQRMIELEALKTRCILIPYYPTKKELKRMINGESLFKLIHYNVKKTTKISKKIYEKIIEKTEKFDIELEYYARTIGDLCRAYSVVGYDDKTFDLILKLRSKKKNYYS